LGKREHHGLNGFIMQQRAMVPHSHIEEGIRYLTTGNAQLALESFQQALNLSPDDAVALYNAGVACYALRRMPPAIDYFRQAVKQAPALVEAHFNLGQACQAMGLHGQAMHAFGTALELNPHYADAAFQLGRLFHALGDNPRAQTYYQRALDANPQHAEALNNLGVIYRDADRIDKALSCFREALSIRPSFAEACYNRGIAAQKNGEYLEGRRFYQQALEIDPGYEPARWLLLLTLPMIYDHEDEIGHYRTQFEHNLTQLVETTPLHTSAQKRSALVGAGTTTNFFLQYQGHNDLDLQKKYGRLVHDIMRANYPGRTWAKAMPSPKGGKIRVGYLSSLMYGHTIGIYLLGWLENHSRSEFELFCYHVGSRVDALTSRVEQIAHHFHHIPGNVETAAQQIESDDLHILVHTDVGMNPITLQLAAMKLAPVQCKGWGHPVTTGLPTIDYYLSSDLMEPHDAEAHYSEQLIRLPNLALCYSPPDRPHAPRSRSYFGISRKRFVLLTTQSLFKYLPQYDDIYPRIAQQAPHVQFVFIKHGADAVTDRFRKRLSRAFQTYRLEMERFCRFVPRMDHADFLSLNLCADVLLDTFDWSGGKTTLEALHCGLPAITCPGSFMRGRHTYAMLSLMDVTETIAKDKEDYCRIAIRLANDSSHYRRIKERVMQNAPRLYHDRGCIAFLERFYRTAIESATPHQQPKADRQTASAPYSPVRGMPPDRADIDRLWQTAVELQQQGKAADAATLYETILLMDPQRWEGHFNRGVCHNQLGEHAKAVQCYRRALAVHPQWPETIFNLARSLEWISDRQGAETHYLDLLKIQPKNAKVMFHLGTLNLNRNRSKKALEWYHRALKLAPDWAILHNNMGKALLAMDDSAGAAGHFEHACRLDPDLAEAWFNRAELHHRAGRWEMAVDNYQQAILRQPQMSAAYNNMGDALKHLKRLPQALEAYSRVVQLEPDLAEAHYNFGSACRLDEQYEKAIEHLVKAVQLRPSYADAWNNLALTYKNIGEMERALSYFNRALDIDPTLAVARWNRSFVHLLKGNWQQGWRDFEWRFDLPNWRSIYPHRITGPRWDGSAAPDKTILVHDEQGLGDTFQFLRYLPLVRKKCRKVIFETRKHLVDLLAGSPGIDQIVVRSPKAPPSVAYDCYIPLMSLAGLFGSPQNNTLNTESYITASKVIVEEWKSALPRQGTKVGIVWAGRPEHLNDANRSCTIDDLATLFQLKEINFIGLQKGPAATQADSVERTNFMNIGDRLNNFADTAGVMANLDLVISVDTSAAHLAGAMGIPVWVMIPYIPDWRWMMHGQGTPWYSSMRLFRQQRPKDWQTVVRAMFTKLEKRTCYP
jgi:predicted O-linked N-acetylglucosamine transferase (SPINDLY family)